MLRWIEDRGLYAKSCGAGIEDSVDAIIKVVKNMRGAGRADVAETVGTGRCQRNPGAADQRKGNRMHGHAHTDERTRRCDDIGNARGTRQEQCERARPEGVDEDLSGRRDRRDDGLSHGEIADMDDERIPVWTLLGEKDFCDGIRIQSVRGESVDGFRGHGHGAAAAENGSRLIQPGGICGRWLPERPVRARKRRFHAEMQGWHRSIIYSQHSQRGKSRILASNGWHRNRDQICRVESGAA